MQSSATNFAPSYNFGGRARKSFVAPKLKGNDKPLEREI